MKQSYIIVIHIYEQIALNDGNNKKNTHINKKNFVLKKWREVAERCR